METVPNQVADAQLVEHISAARYEGSEELSAYRYGYTDPAASRVEWANLSYRYPGPETVGAPPRSILALPEKHSGARVRHHSNGSAGRLRRQGHIRHREAQRVEQSLPKSTVSRLCAEYGLRMKVRDERPRRRELILHGDKHTYHQVKREGRSISALLATGTGKEDHREILILMFG